MNFCLWRRALLYNEGGFRPKGRFLTGPSFLRDGIYADCKYLFARNLRQPLRPTTVNTSS